MTIPPEQRATATLLQGLAGRAPVETHISAVFVGTDTVWKLRKAVRLPFLDFSPLAARERFTRRELALNAPHAPGLYRDVMPVVRRGDGTLALGGAGETVDWVLRMAVVPAENFLDAVAARGGLTPALLDALGDTVAAYHAALPAADRDSAAGLRDTVLGNRDSALAAGLDAAAVRGWTQSCLAILDARRDWLAARQRAGLVRRAHGDLHLGNLCLWQGRVVAFDALEFDEDLATIDLGYDFAFLLMDLDLRVGRAAANRVLNRTIARTGDWDLVPGLKLFLSMRAMVRAHVAARGPHPGEGDAYLRRALAYLDPAPAVVVAVGGLPGTGKSTLARALAPGLGPAPGALVLRSDEIRKRQHGVAPEVLLSPSAYSAEASEAVFAEMFRAVAGVAAAGHGVIADATFLDPGHRRAVERAGGNAHFLGVWLRAPLAVLEARVAGRRGDASDADVAVLRRAAASEAGAPGWLQVDAVDAEAALSAVRIALVLPRGNSGDNAC